MSQAFDPPIQTWPIDRTDPRSLVGTDWLRWFQRAYEEISSCGGSLVGDPKTLATQTASLATQTLSIPGLAAGRAVLNYYLESTAAGTGSSAQVTLGWTHNSRALTRVFPALVTDPVGANASAAIPVLVDANSSVTYAVAATGTLQYSLAVWAQQ